MKAVYLHGSVNASINWFIQLPKLVLRRNYDAFFSACASLNMVRLERTTKYNYTLIN
jgi:hypothetical protein